MTDPLDAPAVRSTGFIRRLHPVTRIVGAAAIISLCGDALQLVGLVSAYQLGSASQPLTSSIAGWLASFAYSLGFIGSAASVEYLVLIWREVLIIRQRR